MSSGAADRYAYLGPAGTFTEAALRAIPAAAGAATVPTADVTAALEAVRRGEVSGAVVPLENSVEGVVPTTVDDLTFGPPLVIAAEVALAVRFGLLVRPGTERARIARVASHPHALAQCRRWIAEQLPGVEVVAVDSTAAAARAVRDQPQDYDAAIAAPVAAEAYGLQVLVEGIGDNEEAWTRFVLARRPGPVGAASGADKTTLSLFMREDHPGALLEILTEFAVRGVNLTRIESRPTKRALGDYYFSIDCEGHLRDARVGETLEGLHRVCADVRFLGSYPRHDGRAPLLRRGVTDADFAQARAWLDRIRARTAD